MEFPVEVNLIQRVFGQVKAFSNQQSWSAFLALYANGGFGLTESGIETGTLLGALCRASYEISTDLAERGKAVGFELARERGCDLPDDLLNALGELDCPWTLVLFDLSGPRQRWLTLYRYGPVINLGTLSFYANSLVYGVGSASGAQKSADLTLEKLNQGSERLMQGMAEILQNQF